VKKEVVLCIDQSGSMAASVVYASVFGAVLASIRSISTRLVVFDTAVVDLTDQLDDPVDVLFGTQLGGGTDINRALAYCQSQITRPAETVVVLISDLYEGGIRDEMLKRVAAMKASGVQFVALLALSDEGAPAYDREHAAALAALGAPAFACTPDLFPEVMAAALEKRPLPIPDTVCRRTRKSKEEEGKGIWLPIGNRGVARSRAGRARIGGARCPAEPRMFSSLTFPAALLGPAVRVLRTAAGRRALQLVLLVGGLFALGFLCGEQAHAADGIPVPAKATSAWPGGTAAHEDPVRAVRTATERFAAPAHLVGTHAIPAAHVAGTQATTPVRGAVTAVSRVLEAGAARGVAQPGTSTPTLALPGFPRVPEVSAPLPPEPKSTAPRPRGHGGAATPAPAERNGRQRPARAHAESCGAAVGAPAPNAAYGPALTDVPQFVARTFAHRGAAGAGVPGGPAPTGDPDGVLGKQAADGSASRHGDAYAVTLDGRAPLRLVPGAAARVDAPRTRERHRDIPVFPG
jgi:hypothetical protein